MRFVHKLKSYVVLGDDVGVSDSSITMPRTKGVGENTFNFDGVYYSGIRSQRYESEVLDSIITKLIITRRAGVFFHGDTASNATVYVESVLHLVRRWMASPDEEGDPNLHLQIYETLESADTMVDLLQPQSKSEAKLRLREDRIRGTFVDGLGSRAFPCSDPDAALAAICEALRRRTVIVGSGLTSTYGFASTVFIRARRGEEGSASILDVVSMVGCDVLSWTKGSTEGGDGDRIMKHCELAAPMTTAVLPPLSQSAPMTDERLAREKQVKTLLQSSTLGISALSRVSTALNCSSSFSSTSRTQHVPFRDSLLTRLLKTFLQPTGRVRQGGCLHMITHLSSLVQPTDESRAQSLTNTLRLAAALGGICSHVYVPTSGAHLSPPIDIITSTVGRSRDHQPFASDLGEGGPRPSDFETEWTRLQAEFGDLQVLLNMLASAGYAGAAQLIGRQQSTFLQREKESDASDSSVMARVGEDDQQGEELLASLTVLVRRMGPERSRALLALGLAPIGNDAAAEVEQTEAEVEAEMEQQEQQQQLMGNNGWDLMTAEACAVYTDTAPSSPVRPTSSSQGTRDPPPSPRLRPLDTLPALLPSLPFSRREASAGSSPRTTNATNSPLSGRRGDKEVEAETHAYDEVRCSVTPRLPEISFKLWHSETGKDDIGAVGGSSPSAAMGQEIDCGGEGGGGHGDGGTSASSPPRKSLFADPAAERVLGWREQEKEAQMRREERERKKDEAFVAQSKAAGGAVGGGSTKQSRYNSRGGPEDDTQGDLTEAEREFLSCVSLSNVIGAKERLSNLVAGSGAVKGKNKSEPVCVNVKNSFGRDGMQIAARNGCVPMLDLLREFGGEIGSRCPRGDTVLHLAAMNGHVDAMRWLQWRGAFPEAVNILGQSAAHVAARRCELSALQCLSAWGCDLDSPDFNDQTPIMCVPRSSAACAGKDEADLLACRTFLQHWIERAAVRI